MVPTVPHPHPPWLNLHSGGTHDCEISDGEFSAMVKPPVVKYTALFTGSETSYFEPSCGHIPRTWI